MITVANFTNLNADSIELNTSVYPLNLYEAEPSERVEEREKAGLDGMWPTFPYDNGMDITLEGSILADDSDDYWTKRQALVSCIRFKPTVRERRSGVWYITFDNAPEQFKVDVVVRTFSAPRNGASPAFSTFRLVMFSFTPYYVGVDSGNYYYDE